MKRLPILTIIDGLTNSERKYIPIEYVEVALKKLLIPALRKGEGIAEEIEKLLNEIKGRNLVSIAMEAEEELQTKCNQCREYARCEREPIDCGFYVPLEETIPGAF